MKQIKAEGEAKHAELKAKQNQLQKAQEENARLEQQLKEQRVSYVDTQICYSKCEQGLKVHVKMQFH